ncbi:two component transcriptional regulator, LuxR family [Pseudoduganella namucuonensis]|uniref:Two component transcriptional regulator, LuxR family n=1 Tax=Pseudoduganella namucuonensis TaxID=1035707 RepID=A0A1I7ILE9_9BURK|nr:two component transcriptional regulator, LuxR family [Pseudoduganella namucuonensis]
MEDDVVFQRAFTDAVAASGDCVMAGVASSLAAGMVLLQGPAADVLVVDLGLPDGSGIDLIHAAQNAWPACGVMVSTMFGDEAHVMRSLEAGATGYLLKDNSASLTQEIRSLHAGGSPISPMIARQVLMRFRQAPPAPPAIGAQEESALLSAREREVLSLITKGFTANEIADLIQVSRHTVPTYVRRIYRKLKVNSKAEAIYEAHQHGFISP